MSNIDDFNIVVGLIFSKLYEEFPIPCWIGQVEHVEVLNQGKLTREQLLKLDEQRAPGMEPLYRSHAEEEMMAIAEHGFAIHSGAMEWLIAEGFIRAVVINDGTYSNCVLALKGLEALSLTPDAVRQSKTIGDQVVENVKSGSLDAVKDLAKRAVSYGLALSAQAVVRSALGTP